MQTVTEVKSIQQLYFQPMHEQGKHFLEPVLLIINPCWFRGLIFPTDQPASRFCSAQNNDPNTQEMQVFFHPEGVCSFFRNTFYFMKSNLLLFHAES